MEINGNELNIDLIRKAWGHFVKTGYAFCERAVALIDDATKNNHLFEEESEYIDLVAETFFSIRAFCILMDDGLVSTACGITRIILEETAIAILASESKDNKKRFLQFRNDRSDYFSLSAEERKKYNKRFEEEHHLKKVKQYFDYGWCKTSDGKPITSLKGICELVGFMDKYYLVENAINSFAHGQLSIYRIRRNQKNLDIKFINCLYELVCDCFVSIIEILKNEFCSGYFNENDLTAVEVTNTLCYYFHSCFRRMNDLRNVHISIDDYKKNLQSEGLKKLYSFLLDSKNDYQRLLLSQAYMNSLKDRIQGFVFYYLLPSENKEVNFNKLKALFNDDVLEKVKCFKSETNIGLMDLVNYLDLCQTDWILKDNDIQYIKCANDLLEYFSK